MTAPRTARERARAEITAEILAASRQHLARDGAAGLSLRAVARDVGMVSSAVYRYVPNRDALLTMLIIEAYDGVGAAVEAGEAAIRRTDHRGRFLAACRALRGWAVAHPHEYALIYGSPVPGYAAPEATIAPATRVPMVLVAILTDMQERGDTPAALPVTRATQRSLAPVMASLGETVSEDLMLRGLSTWAALLGTVSLELFGHLHNVVADDDVARSAYFDEQMSRVARELGA